MRHTPARLIKVATRTRNGVLAAALGTLVLVAAGAPAATSAGSGKTSFPALLTYVARDGGLCLVRADGTHAVRLTARHKRWENPSWSPDGRYVAFDRSGGYDSYSADPAAKIVVADARDHVRWVFGAGSTNYAPRWSPDGLHIVYFAVWAHLGSLDDARPDGSHDHGIASTANAYNRPEYAADPTWTPDGQRLLFDALPDPATHLSRSIFSAALDGSERTMLVANADDPAFSPDGSMLAYAGATAAGDGVVVADADGSSPRLIFPSTLAAPGLAWSPDGRSLAFAAATSADGVELVTVRADGTGARVVAGPWSDASLVGWSPNGKLLAFERDARISVVSSRGGRPQLLVRTGRFENAAWRPPVALPAANRPACSRRG